MTYYEHCRYRGVDGVCVVCVNFLDPQVLELVREYDMRRRQNAQEASGNIELEATLHENGWNYYYGRKSYTLTFTVGPADGKKYVLKAGIRALQEYVQRKRLGVCETDPRGK